MQTYTHLVIGAVTGQVMFPENYPAQAACVVGAGATDALAVLKMVSDKVRGEKPFSKCSPAFQLGQQIINSVLVWGTPAWLLHSNPVLFAFFLSGAINVFVDSLTHGRKRDMRFRDTEQSYLWPLPVKLGRIVGLWEYRYDHGVLTPKPLEGVILVALCAVAVYLFFN